MRGLSAEELRLLRAWLKKQGVARPEDYRPTFLARRVRPRLPAFGGDLSAYLKHAGRSPEALSALLQRLLVPTTEFFRNRDVFEETVNLAAGRMESGLFEKLRILCAACSTGEEPYGLAILLREARLQALIVALDRSMPALRAVIRGTFPERALAKVDNGLKERYFGGTGGGRAVAALRRKVHPLCWDLGAGLPPGPFEIVLLRNVMIYFTEDAQKRLAEQAAAALVPGGLLVLGKVEALIRGSEMGLEPVNRGLRIYEKAWRRA